MEIEEQDISSEKLVMLIDDNSIDNFVNQSIIEKYKFAKKIISFTKATDALDYLSDIDETEENSVQIPSFIFLDLNMPLINGFQFLEIFDKLSAHIKSNCKIIILSNSVNPGDIIQSGINKNVFTFLQKPLLKTSLDELNVTYKNNLKIKYELK